MKAYQGKEENKRAIVAEMKAHREADRLIQRRYWEDGKGCAVGCLVKSDDHAALSTKLGIPTELCHLLDSLFERMYNEDAQAFPVEFLEALQVGVDYSFVWPKFAHWLLVDDEHGVVNRAGDKKHIISEVAMLYEKVIKGEHVDQEKWWICRGKAIDAYNDSLSLSKAYCYWCARSAAFYFCDTSGHILAAMAASAHEYSYNTNRPSVAKRQAEKLIEIIKNEKSNT